MRVPCTGARCISSCARRSCPRTGWPTSIACCRSIRASPTCTCTSCDPTIRGSRCARAGSASPRTMPWRSCCASGIRRCACAGGGERDDRGVAVTTWLDFEKPVLELEQKIHELREVNSGLTAYQRVQLARHPRRPYALDYIARIFTDWTELHGDRHFADDPAIVAGPGFLDGQPVMVIGQQKGRDTRENLHRRF